LNRFGWILVLLAAGTPSWAAARKITVEQLGDMLHKMQEFKKADADVATELKQIELTEELKHATMDRLSSAVPGPLSTEQMYVLEAKCATLAPPPADLPATPAPDAAAQKALLDKALGYAADKFAQLPGLTATKTTRRFQDNTQAPANNNGMGGGSVASQSPDSLFVHYIGSNAAPVELQNGVEKLPKKKDSTQWGSNGQIVSQGQGPALNAILQEARTAGTINWLRWETINGRQAGVFKFGVDKKKSHYAITYCCFPDLDHTGGASLFGQTQVYTHWVPFSGNEPYHGQIFVDTATGVILRLVIETDLKSSDPVKQEETRIDYGAVMIDDKPLIVPVRTFLITEVAPSGDSAIGTGKYASRHTLFTTEYTDYKPAGHP